ncbi:MFS transporter [Streptomyces sp. NPDC003247]|uniref:MFS transporter n=1 Tax=Streptomyces sp. NPDC003247 TaxID=3364677 RepID=UPI0036815FEC
MTLADHHAAQPPPWRTAGLAGMASYLDGGAIVTTGIALVLLKPSLGLTAGSIGGVSAALTLSIAIGAMVGGRLGDLYGRRRVFTLTLVGFAVGVGLLGTAASLPMLYAGAILTGLAAGADLPVSLALINEEAPEGQKGRMVAFSQVLWLIGIVASVVLSIGLASLGALGGRLLYGHLFLVAVVVTVLRGRMRESSEWVRAHQGTERRAGSGRLASPRRFRQMFKPPVLAALLATGLYYALWNLGVNTVSQFNTYLFTELAGGSVRLASVAAMLGFPVSLVCAALFMRVVDRPARRVFFRAGLLLSLAAFATPVVLGVTVQALVIFGFLVGIGGAFAGEGIYKVWTQEYIPTLLRGSAGGVTLAFARLMAAAFALVTPELAVYSGRLLFGILLTGAVIAALIGTVVIPRLPMTGDLSDRRTTDAPSSPDAPAIRS